MASVCGFFGSAPPVEAITASWQAESRGAAANAASPSSASIERGSLNGRACAAVASTSVAAAASRRFRLIGRASLLAVFLFDGVDETFASQLRDQRHVDIVVYVLATAVRHQRRYDVLGASAVDL